METTSILAATVPTGGQAAREAAWMLGMIRDADPDHFDAAADCQCDTCNPTCVCRSLYEYEPCRDCAEYRRLARARNRRGEPIPQPDVTRMIGWQLTRSAT